MYYSWDRTVFKKGINKPMILLKLTYLPKFSACFSEMSDYIPEGKLDPTTFQSVMDAADVKYCLAKVSSYLV